MKIKIEDRYDKVTLRLRSSEKSGYFIQTREVAVANFPINDEREYSIGRWRRNTYDMDQISGETFFVMGQVTLPSPIELIKLLEDDSGDGYFDLLLSYLPDDIDKEFLNNYSLTIQEETENDWHRETVHNFKPPLKGK